MIGKSSFWIVVVLLLKLLVTPHIARADEKRFTGISSSELQTQVNTLPKQGYRPTEIKGYSRANELRFDITWENKPGSRWIMHHNMSLDQFNTHKEDLKLTGYHVKLENSYRHNGTTQYVALWEQGNNPGPQVELPRFTWLDKTKQGFTSYFMVPGHEVVLIALTWDGSMKQEVCQQVYSHVLNDCLQKKTTLNEPSNKRRLNDKNVYFFGYYSLYEKKGEWIAMFPGLRTSNGEAAGCEVIRSNGERYRTKKDKEEELIWKLTNGQAVILTYRSDHTGFKYGMMVNDPDIKVRDK